MKKSKHKKISKEELSYIDGYLKGQEETTLNLAEVSDELKKLMDATIIVGIMYALIIGIFLIQILIK